MTTNEEGPTVPGEAFEIASRPIPEECTTMSSIAESTDTHQNLAAEVAEALEAIDAGSPHVVEFIPTEALYLDPEGSCSVPAADLNMKGSRWTTLARCFDLSGQRVRPDEAYWRHWLPFVSRADRASWRSMPNGAIRLGEYLAISAGQFTDYHEYEADGERWVELVTREELERRREEGKRSWLAAHAADVDAAMPPGFTSWELCEYLADDDVSIMYEREIGPVSICWAASVQGSRVELDGAGPDALVRVGNVTDSLSVSGMRELASALMAAIPMVEAAAA